MLDEIAVIIADSDAKPIVLQMLEKSDLLRFYCRIEGATVAQNGFIRTFGAVLCHAHTETV